MKHEASNKPTDQLSQGSPPLKKIGGQNMQNFGRFYTTFDFDREYLRNGLRYPKSEN